MSEETLDCYVVEGTLDRGQHRSSKSIAVKPSIEDTLEVEVEVEVIVEEVVVGLAVRSQLSRTALASEKFIAK